MSQATAATGGAHVDTFETQGSNLRLHALVTPPRHHPPHLPPSRPAAPPAGLLVLDIDTFETQVSNLRPPFARHAPSPPPFSPAPIPPRRPARRPPPTPFARRASPPPSQSAAPTHPAGPFAGLLRPHLLKCRNQILVGAAQRPQDMQHFLVSRVLSFSFRTPLPASSPSPPAPLSRLFSFSFRTAIPLPLLLLPHSLHSSPASPPSPPAGGSAAAGCAHAAVRVPGPGHQERDQLAGL